MVTEKADGACQLHNVQFYNLLPRAIVCSAFGALPKKLALARDDGTIEIWNMANAPFLEKTIPGGSGISIEGLAWAGNRLFSVSLAGTVIEWDLAKIPSVKQSILVTGNAIWCIDISKDDRLLAVGTEGGYINVYRLENDEVTYERILDKQEGRIICCCFDWSGDYLVTGSADAVRVWDVRNGHAVHKMTTGRSNRNQETTVWAVTVLPDFTIVSADSRGKMVVYDGQMGTVLEQHVVSTADLLCLALDVQNNAIFVAGVEPTIRVYIRLEKKQAGGDKQFVRAFTRRGHTHDIKTMVSHGRYLFSGGLDGMVLISAARPHTVDVYYPLLPSPASQVVRECRLVLLKYVNYLEVWTLAPHNKPKEGGTKVLQIRSKNDEHIVCAAMSSNGRWIVYSTEHTIRLLRYDYNSQDPVNSRLLRVRNTPEHLAVCYRADFTHDSTGLFLYDRTGEGTINFFSCAADDNEEWDHKQSIDAGRWLSEMVHLSAVSSCNRYLVCADVASSIVVFERTIDSKWKRSISLPRYKLPPTALAIQPSRTRVAVAFTDHKLFVYDFDQFSFVFSTYVKLTLASFSISHIAFDPRHESAMLLQNGSKIVSLRYGPDIEEEMLQRDERTQNKRQRPMMNGSMNGNSGEGEGSLTKYKLRLVRDAPRLVTIEWLAENELVATQANALSMVEHLPPAFRGKAYGKR